MEHFAMRPVNSFQPSGSSNLLAAGRKAERQISAAWVSQQSFNDAILLAGWSAAP
jgi:hypothetical protein